MSATAPTSWPTNHVTQSFTPLARTIRDAGMLRRHYLFYTIFVATLVLALGGIITGMVLLGDSWLQLLMAGALGVVLTQFAFFGHEAFHRTVFASPKANDIAGKVTSTLVVGISFQWWMNKHSRHHVNPNVRGKDPDLDIDTISFLPEDAAKARGLQAWITRRQKWTELSLITAHFALYLVPLFAFLPLGMAFALRGLAHVDPAGRAQLSG